MTYAEFKKQAAEEDLYQGTTADKFYGFQQDVEDAKPSLSQKWNAFADDMQHYGLELPNVASLGTQFRRGLLGGPVGQAAGFFWDNRGKMLPNTIAKTVGNIVGLSKPKARENLRNDAMSKIQASADKFINSMNLDDIGYLQKNYDQMIGSVGGADSPEGRAMSQYIRQGLQAKTWDAVKQNPLQNIPKAVGVWLRNQGMGQLGDFASNPMAFYGSLLALLLGGGALLGGGRD